MKVREKELKRKKLKRKMKGIIMKEKVRRLSLAKIYQNQSKNQ